VNQIKIMYRQYHTGTNIYHVTQGKSHYAKKTKCNRLKLVKKEYACNSNSVSYEDLYVSKCKLYNQITFLNG